MTPEKIKPIPKYLIERIRKADRESYLAQDGHVRFYAYLTKNEGELVKMTVAVKKVCNGTVCPVINKYIKSRY